MSRLPGNRSNQTQKGSIATRWTPLRPSTQCDAEHPGIAWCTDDETAIARLDGHVLEIVAVEQVSGEDRHFPVRRAIADAGVDDRIALEDGKGRVRRIAEYPRNRCDMFGYGTPAPRVSLTAQVAEGRY